MEEGEVKMVLNFYTSFGTSCDYCNKNFFRYGNIDTSYARRSPKEFDVLWPYANNYFVDDDAEIQNEVSNSYDKEYYGSPQSSSKDPRMSMIVKALFLLAIVYVLYGVWKGIVRK